MRLNASKELSYLKICDMNIQLFFLSEYQIRWYQPVRWDLTDLIAIYALISSLHLYRT